MNTRLSFKKKALLWFVLIFLLVFLLAFQFHFKEEVTYFPIIVALQSSAFLFALLFSTITGMILLLAFWSGGGLKDIEAVILLAIASTIFLNLWNLLFPVGTAPEQIAFVTQAKAILSSGGIPSSLRSSTGGPYEYLDFPGLMLLLASVSEVTRLPLILSPSVVLSTNAFAIPLVVYVSARKVGIPSVYSFLGTLIFIEGNEYLATTFFFRPDSGISIALFATVTLLMMSPFGTIKPWVLALICTTTLAVSHPPTDIFVIGTMTAIAFLLRHKSWSSSRIKFVVISVIIAIAWLAFFSVYFAPYELNILMNTLSNGFHFGTEASVAVADLTSAGLFALVPRYFWLLIIYGLGGVACLSMIRRKWSVGIYEPKLLALLLPIALISGTMFLFGYHIYTYVEFGAVPSTIALAGLFFRSRLSFRTIPIVAIICLFSVIAFPTMVSFHPHLGVDIVYQHNLSTASYVSTYTLSRTTIFPDAVDGVLIQYFSPQLLLSWGFFVGTPAQYGTYLEESFFSNKMVVASNGFFTGDTLPGGPSPNDVWYRNLMLSINANRNIVYDNSFGRVYYTL
jgi:hypothetical protein